MKDSEIENRFEQQDKDLKSYVDMKIRAIKKMLAPFIWMEKNPGKTIIALIIMFMLSAFLFHVIDFKKTFERKTGIELKDIP